MQPRRVVVTGLGALTAIGNSIEDYKNALFNGISGASDITKFDASNFKTRFACEVKNFDPSEYIHKKLVRKMDPFTHYGMAVAKQAMEDSGLLVENAFNPFKAGVIWGSGIGGLISFQQEVMDYALGDGIPRFSPYFIPKMIADITGGYISMEYKLMGPNYTTVSACASSNNALLDAFNYIRLGMADVIVSGGSEACVVEAAIGGFSNMKALSERNDDPQSASRPFDKNRDGFVLGEGAGCLILESLDHAQARGAKIYAEITGGGMTADAYHITAPHPEGEGAAHSMMNALEDAQLKPTDIDYINVHGTSTPLGDISELKAIKKVFGEDAYNLNISSTKSMTGHLLGAAGAVEAIACIFAINNNIVPPTINFKTPDENIDQKLNLTTNKAQEKTINAALTNTFGFGGHNVTLILKQFN